MIDSDPQRKHPIVPPSEHRCVWMTAGVLSYQLCEREFDCEHCPLDSALRQRFVVQSTVLPQKSTYADDAISESSRGTMLYGRKHVWVRSASENSVRLGIEPGLASVLLSPKAVVLPAIGEQVVRNKVCSWVVMEGGTLPITSPVTGKVNSTNAQLAENPHMVCSSPLAQGWLLGLSVDEPVVRDDDLLLVADVAPLYAKDDERFQTLLSAELMRGGSVVGPTLADGGQALGNLSAMLGPTKYYRLVRNVYT